jgi:alpha-tubulin suppressor-like RCC1 family protein
MHCAAGFKIMYDPQPTPALIATLTGHNIVKIACGHNHTIALDDKGAAFTWGNGNYGKLGHKVGAGSGLKGRTWG